MELDTNILSKTGSIVTPVDFQHLKDVFVITVNKQDSIQGKGQTDVPESVNTDESSDTQEGVAE